MKKARFWFLMLCCLLINASVNGMDPALQVAIIANSILVLMEVAHRIYELKTDRM